VLKTIPHTRLTHAQRQKLNTIFDEVIEDKFIGGEWFKALRKSLEHGELGLLVVLLNDSPCGFYQPRYDHGFWRSGVVYIELNHRGEGIMTKVLEEFFSKHTPAKAWIANQNKSSVTMYEKLGFKREKEYNLSKDPIEQGAWYLKEK
jgi:GNAT superfamily N-acetyltransferase